MGLWTGVGKILSGVEDVLNSPQELYHDIKYRRRDALSGKYTVHIPAEHGHPYLIAHITL